MAKRHYSARWTYDDTVRFIEARIKLDYIFTGKIYDLRSSWELVGAEAGIDENWSKLRKKWANIMTKYKSIVDPPTGIGTEDEGPESLIWLYFEIVHEFASARHNINPPNLFDTAPPPEMLILDYEDSTTSHSKESASPEESQSVASSSHRGTSTSSSVASSSRSVRSSSRGVASPRVVCHLPREKIKIAK